MSLQVLAQNLTPVIMVDRFSSLDQLKHITAWMMRFVQNCRKKDLTEQNKSHLTTFELSVGENY